MSATPAQVMDGVLLFMENEILPALSGWKLGVAGAALIRFRQTANNLIPVLTSNKLVAALGLVGEDGSIDVAGATAALKESIGKHGKLEVDLPLLGTFKFSKENVDALAEYIAQAGAATR